MVNAGAIMTASVLVSAHESKSTRRYMILVVMVMMMTMMMMMMMMMWCDMRS